jgi:hypothetical protein
MVCYGIVSKDETCGERLIIKVGMSQKGESGYRKRIDVWSRNRFKVGSESMLLFLTPEGMFEESEIHRLLRHGYYSPGECQHQGREIFCYSAKREEFIHNNILNRDEVRKSTVEFMSGIDRHFDVRKNPFFDGEDKIFLILYRGLSRKLWSF